MSTEHYLAIVFPITCKRCGHNWIPRIINIVQCPHCKSARWNQSKEVSAEYMLRDKEVK